MRLFYYDIQSEWWYRCFIYILMLDFSSCRAFAKNVSEEAGKVISLIVSTAQAQQKAKNMLQMLKTDYENLSSKLKDVRSFPYLGGDVIMMGIGSLFSQLV